MSRADERKKAAELKALDIREFIRNSLPALLPHLTPQHLDQLQRVLDAEAINADVQSKWEELDRKSIKGQIVHSNEYLRDPAAVARRDQVLKQKISVKPTDGVVRLDFQKLLTPDALRPTSDNPDEAAFLLILADVYEQKGVWLVLDTDSSAMARNAHAEPNDPKHWRLRTLLGYKYGALVEEIQTANGSLTRKALLSVGRLASAYWQWIDQGPTLSTLKKAIEQVSSKIAIGRSEHFWWSAHRDDYYVVSRVSDKLGGADWPDEDIWNQPSQIQIRALYLINEGKLMESAKFAQLAAYQAEWCARAVHEYIADTTRGASRAVKILEVAETCGKIAEAILSILAVGEGLIRLLSRKGAASAAEAGAQRQLTGGQRQLPAPAEPAPVPRGPNGTLQGSGVGAPPGGGVPVPGPAVKRPPGTAISGGGKDMQNAVDYARQQVGLPPLPEKTILGPLGASERLQYKRLHKEFMDWLMKNPNASLAEKNARLERVIEARWRAPSPTD